MSNNVQYYNDQCKLIESSSYDFIKFLNDNGHPLTKNLIANKANVPFKCPHSTKSQTSARYSYMTNGDWSGLHCHKCSITVTFRSNQNDRHAYKFLTEEQIKALEAKREQELKQKQIRQEQAQIRVDRLWGKAIPATSQNCIYIKNKQICPYDTRILHGTLFVPVHDLNNKIINLEHIYYDDEGQRRSARVTHARTDGFGIISEPKNNIETIYLGEGFATMATVHEATGNPCFFSFGAGNLKKVYDLLRKKYINKIIITADNNEDHKGEKSARAVCDYVLCPVPKDFNDLFIEQLTNKGMSRMQALTVVKGAIESAKENKFNFIEFPDPGSKGPLATIDNTRALLKAYNITLKYNVMKYRREISIPNTSLNPTGLLNDQLTYICSLAAKHGLARAQIDSHLDLIAGENRYHPIVDVLNSTKWDGISRIGDFIKTLTVIPEQEAFAVMILRKWLFQGVKAIKSQNGYGNGIMLMLSGPQGLGKTSWCREFFSTIDPEATMTDFSLDPNKKDDVMRFYEFAFIELGEAELTINKSRMAAVKRILTAEMNQERKAYARHDSLRFRRSFVVATVNHEKCLVDETGNRRFAPIEVTHIDYNYSSHIDMRQLLAEVNFYLDAGESEVFTKEEMNMINESNKRFEEVDVLEEMLFERFDFDAYLNGYTQTIEMSLSEIYSYLPFQNSTPDKSMKARLCRVLKKHLIDKPKEIKKIMIYKMPVLR